MQEQAFKEYHRYLIQAHPTFQCPVTKEILDVDHSYVVQYLHPSKGSCTDVISKRGYEKLSEEQRNNVNMKILTEWAEI